MKQFIVRRSQAERKVTTRNAVLAAAISVIYEQGYSATTMALVAERAGVSRGAMLNHFPTKADLMTFVVEEVFRDESRQYDQILAGAGSRRERLLGYVDAAWQVLGRPSAVAVLEIFLGCRSDPVLLGKLKSIQERIEEDSYRRLETELGRPPLAANVTLVTWAMRGLSIRNVVFGKEGNDAAVSLLREYVETALDNRVLPPLD